MITPFSKLTAEFFHAGKQTVPQMWALNGQKDQITYKMMRDWEKHGFDAMLSCPFPMPAISPDYCSKAISGKTNLGRHNMQSDIVFSKLRAMQQSTM